MVADLNRMENAARLAMADTGAESRSGGGHLGIPFAVKLSLFLASLALTGLMVASLL